MDAHSLICRDLGVRFQRISLGGKNTSYAKTVARPSWQQQPSPHSSRHLVTAPIVPEATFWNKKFPAFLARNRLHTIQLCLQPATGSLIDAVLCIAGNDGHNNTGSTRFLAYLVQGKSANQLATKEEIMSEAMSELVLVVEPDSVCLWTPSRRPYLADGSHHIAGLAANWPNCELWQHEASDDHRDAYELAKINFFVNYFRTPDATAGLSGDRTCSCIVGVPFGPDEDPMSVEKWPLMQAYALGDGVGAGTFFTLRHTVCDSSHLVGELTRNLDAQTLRVAMLCHLPRLAKHWRDSLQMLSGFRKATSRATLSEVDVVEALSTFFHFGQLARQADSRLVPPESVFQGARVLFGPRTAQAGLRHVAHISSEDVSLGTVEGQHFTVEGQDALSGLKAARTYFLSTCSGETARDRVARRLYEEVVDCHQACMEQLGGLLSQHMHNSIAGQAGMALSLRRFETALAKHVASELRHRVTDILEDEDDTEGLEFFRLVGESSDWVHVNILAFDSVGRPTSTRTIEILESVSRKNFYAEVKVFVGEDHGALLLGDTMPALALGGINSGGHDHNLVTEPWPTNPLVLTGCIPYFQVWQHARQESLHNNAFDESMENPSFTSNNVVHFNAEAASVAHSHCTGIGIGNDTGVTLRDCIMLLNNPEQLDDADEDDGTASQAGDFEAQQDIQNGPDAVSRGPRVPCQYQNRLLGDIRLRETGFVFRPAGMTPIALSLFEAATDVQECCFVDVCEEELSLFVLDLTERAQSLIFNDQRAYFARRTTAVAIVLPANSDVKGHFMRAFAKRSKFQDTQVLRSFRAALQQLVPFQMATVAPYLQAAAEQDRLLLKRAFQQLGALHSSPTPEVELEQGTGVGSTEPARAIVVTGSGHSGKGAVAQAVARELNRTGVNDGDHYVFDQNDLYRQAPASVDAAAFCVNRIDGLSLEAWIAKHRHCGFENQNAKPVFVIVAPDFLSAPNAVLQLQSLPTEHIVIQASIHTINMSSYTVEAARIEDKTLTHEVPTPSQRSFCAPAVGTLPAVFQSLVPGFLSGVVLTNCTSTTASDAHVHMRRLLETCMDNTGAGTGEKIRVLRASGGVGTEPIHFFESPSRLIPASLELKAGLDTAPTGGDFSTSINHRLRFLHFSPTYDVTSLQCRKRTWVGSAYGRLGVANLKISVSTPKPLQLQRSFTVFRDAPKTVVRFSVLALQAFCRGLFPRGGTTRLLGEPFSITGFAFVRNSSGVADVDNETGNSAEVCVRFCAAAPNFWTCEDPILAASSVGPSLRTTSSTSNSQTRTAKGLVWSAVEIGVVSANLNPHLLRQLFIKHVWEEGDVHQLRERLSVATLTNAQKEEIKQEHIGAPLPQGYYFDGANFINADRHVQKYHPDMQLFMEQYVEQQLTAAEKAACHGVQPSDVGEKTENDGTVLTDIEPY